MSNQQRFNTAQFNLDQFNSAGFDAVSDDIFNRQAHRYQILCHFFSLGLHRHWKTQVANAVNAEPWQNLLDVASGTGDIVHAIIKQHESQLLTDPIYHRYTVTDISTPMLTIAKDKLSKYQAQTRFINLDAHDMSVIDDNTQDVVTVSLALKICNRQQVLREALRVLKPQGRLIVLETSTLSNSDLHAAYLMYLSIILPAIGCLITGGDESSYRYLLNGIKGFPSAEVLAQEMVTTGFEKVTFERLHLGVVAIHIAYKPTDNRSMMRATL